MYDLSGFNRPVRRPASPGSFCFVVNLGIEKLMIYRTIKVCWTLPSKLESIIY